MTWGTRRRFWTAASVRRAEGGFAIYLDDRALQTPAKAPLLVPTSALAAAIAAEWNAIGDTIEPRRLPFTRAANSAIDRVGPQWAEVASAVAAYGETDLICYRAEEPGELRDRQAAGWDPWLAWAERELGAPLVAVAGLMPRAQPPASVAALASTVAGHDAFALTALHDLVALAGSLVLGLAVSRGVLAGAEAWALSRIDEAWQAEHWGADAEAAAASSRAQADFLRAEALIGLLQRKDPRAAG